MTDFVQTMRDWKRMCKVYTREDEDDCCKDCPMGNMGEHGCDAIFSDFPEYGSWDDVEKIIDEWAAEHPEPVYPTWEEWLVANGVMEPDNVRLNGDYRFYHNGKPVYNIPSPKMFDPIPADIAQKLGIEPKEGV